MRNMEKTVEKIKGKFNNKSISDRYDMTLDEMLRLMDMVHEGKAPEAICMAFDYGFILGHRATATGKVANSL